MCRVISLTNQERQTIKKIGGVGIFNAEALRSEDARGFDHGWTRIRMNGRWGREGGEDTPSSDFDAAREDEKEDEAEAEEEAEEEELDSRLGWDRDYWEPGDGFAEA
jgi:hypothetical protein